MGLMGIGLAANRYYEEEREARREAERQKTAFEQQKELIDYRAGVAATQEALAEDRQLRRDVDAFLSSNGLEDTPEYRRLAASAVRAYGLQEANVMFAEGNLSIEGSGPQAIAPDELGAMLNQVNSQFNLPEGYLYTTAGLESSYNPNARNSGSSAGGLFQQLDGNARQYGVTNRFDPMESTLGAAKFARDNAQVLRRTLGREPTAAELYLAHQQGPGGASALLSRPNENVLEVMTRIHRGNRDKAREAIELNGGNLSMTAGEFASLWLNKYNSSAAVFDPGDSRATTTTAPDGFSLGTSTDNEMSDLFTGDSGLSFGTEGGPDDWQTLTSAEGLDTGRSVDREAQLPSVETPSTLRLSLNTPSGVDWDSLIGKDKAYISSWMLVNQGNLDENDLNRAVQLYNNAPGGDTDFPDPGSSLAVLQDFKTMNPDLSPEKGAVLDQLIENARTREGLDVEEPEWANIANVRPSNWRALEAGALEEGNEEQAARIRELGQSMEGAGYDLSDQTYFITYEDENGQTRRVTAPVDQSSGRFIDLSTGNAIDRDQIVEAIPSADVTGFTKEYARIASRVEPLQERRGALLDTMRSAQSLDNLVRQNDNILTSIGGGGTRLINSLRQEFDALKSLVSSGATSQEIDAEINRIAQENASIISDISDQAQLATLFNAEVLRFAFNYAKTGLGQDGVGLSNKDFDNALSIVSAGSSYDTFSKNLRSRVSEGISSVENTRLELNEDPAVRAVLEMPNAEGWTSDLLNSSTEQFVQSRGMGDMYEWSQSEPEMPGSDTGNDGTPTPSVPDGQADLDALAETMTAYRNSPQFTREREVYSGLSEEDQGLLLRALSRKRGIPVENLRDMLEED